MNVLKYKIRSVITMIRINNEEELGIKRGKRVQQH